jgi:hypothetical protein
VLLFFRNNQFTTFFPLALYLVLTHLAALLGLVQPIEMQQTNGGALYAVLFGWASAKPFYSALVATILIFLQAIQINTLADEFRLLSERTWLPALFYALAASCLPDFLFLSPPLVAATFIPIALRRIFQSYQKPIGAAYILDAAFWVTMSSLFYPPAIFLLTAAVAGVLTMRSFSFKEQWVFVAGVMVPLVLGWLGFFWADQGKEFLLGQFSGLFGLYGFGTDWNAQTILKAVSVGAVVLFVMFNSGRFYYRKLIQTQKCVTVLYWFLGVAAATALLQSDILPAHFVLLMSSAGIFLSMVFSAMRNRMLAEIAHLLLLGFVLFVQYLPK